MKKHILLTCLMFCAFAGLSARGSVEEPVSQEGGPAGEGNAARRIVQAGSAAFIVQDALYMFPEAPLWVQAVSDGNQGNGMLAQDMDGRIGGSADGKPVLPRKANTESIAALRPDTVVLKHYLKGSTGEALEQMGLPVLYVNLESPEAWLSDILRLGELFGNERRAMELQGMFQKRMDTVETALSGLKEEEKPRVLFLYWSVRDGTAAVNVPPENWMQTRLVKMAGGIPVWIGAKLGKRWTRVNLEQIAAWNPDEIIVAAYHIPAASALEEIYSDSSWALLEAVQKGRVRAMPADYHSWDQPGAAWILGLQWLASIWHPERFPDMNMKEEVASFYSDFFSRDGAFLENHVLPRLSGLE